VTAGYLEQRVLHNPVESACVHDVIKANFKSRKYEIREFSHLASNFWIPLYF